MARNDFVTIADAASTFIIRPLAQLAQDPVSIDFFLYFDDFEMIKI
jgi:hypothetical protein